MHSSGASVTWDRDAQGRITTVTDPAGAVTAYAYDGNGDLASVTDREENATRFGYHPSIPHHLETIEDPRGIQPIRNDYDDAGRLIRHTDAYGKTIEYTHDLNARQEVVQDRLGQVRVLEYDERGNVVRETQPDGRVVVRTFDGRNNRLSETEPHDPGDPSPATTAYTYDVSDNLTSTTDPLGNTTSQTYDAFGNVLTSTDARNQVTANEYDGNGNLTKTTDADLKETTFTYDTRGNVLTQTDAENHTTRFEYGFYGHLSKETDALGHETSYTYDGSGNRLTQTTTRTLFTCTGTACTPSGTQTLLTQFHYDHAGRLTETIDPDGTSSVTEYDALGKQSATVDKKGRRTTFDYDDMGRLVKTTYPDLTTEESTYDAEGRRLTSQDRAGRTTSYEYDPQGRLTKTTFPDLSFTENVYDVAGRLESTTDARGNATHYEYDAAGRRTKVIDALSHETVFTYDDNGNQQTVTDARGKTTTYTYDALSRRTRTTFHDGTFTETGYDALGRRTSETDPAGKTTQFEYDALGRLTAVVDALHQRTEFGYDELGNRIFQTDANGHVTGFEYDLLGRETARILPDGSRETKTYDAAGNLETRTDFAGRTTTYTYDTNNRLLTKTFPDTSEVTYTYTATGRRETVTDARGATGYTYDTRDRLETLTYPDGRRLEYGYDAQGNRTKLTAILTAASLVTNGTFDVLNRLETVTDPATGVYTHGYDDNGNRASLAFPSGVGTAYTYDDLNRLTLIDTTHAGTTIQSFAYTLGPAGNRTRIDENGGTVREYGYDNLYRLTDETVTIGGGLYYAKSFSYDPVGNRTQQATTGAGLPGTPTAQGTIDYTYDTRDRLTLDGPQPYTWDPNGNLVTKDAEATYTWDFEDRLVRADKTDGTVVEYVYDADGNRVRTTTTPAGRTAEVTDYLVDTSGSLSQVVAETDATGTLAAYYVRGDDLLAVLRPDGGGGFSSRYYHADGLGSIRALTDQTGAVTDTYTYTAFGERLTHTGTDPQPYAFTGEPLDPNTGFQYHRARWMDPGTGRFLGMDPFGGSPFEPGTVHKYAYAGGNPPTQIDPSGRFFAEFSLGVSIQGTLAATAVVSMSAVFGAIDGGLRAQLKGQDWVVGALKGARVGIFLSPLATLRVAQPFLVAIGSGLAASGAFEAYMDGNTGLALYNGILFVGAATAVLSSVSQQGFTGGNVLVYRSIDRNTGQVTYVGITDNFAARAAAHLRTKGIEIEEVRGLQNLTRNDARAVEQALIEYYGLGKNGGTLLNKINSVSPRDPEYASFLARGWELLTQAGIL